jgi:hypothetical protein
MPAKKDIKENKMLAEISKWFMDIAKYVTTVCIIATILGQYKETVAFFVIGFIITFVTFGAGVLFLKKSQKK